MVVFPAVVQDVTETKDAVGRRRRGETLPIFELVAWAAEGDDTVHALVEGEACRRGRTVRGARHDDFVPTQPRA